MFKLQAIDALTSAWMKQKSADGKPTSKVLMLNRMRQAKRNAVMCIGRHNMMQPQLRVGAPRAPVSMAQHEVHLPDVQQVHLSHSACLLLVRRLRVQ